MTATTGLTDAQRRALAVLAVGHRDLRPVRVSNETASPTKHQGMLRIHWQAADALQEHGLIDPPTAVVRLVRLTVAGRAFAAEAGL